MDRFEYDPESIHVIPKGEECKHEKNIDCDCRPSIEPGMPEVVIHFKLKDRQEVPFFGNN